MEKTTCRSDKNLSKCLKILEKDIKKGLESVMFKKKKAIISIVSTIIYWLRPKR